MMAILLTYSFCKEAGADAANSTLGTTIVSKTPISGKENQFQQSAWKNQFKRFILRPDWIKSCQ